MLGTKSNHNVSQWKTLKYCSFFGYNSWLILHKSKMLKLPKWNFMYSQISITDKILTNQSNVYRPQKILASFSSSQLQSEMIKCSLFFHNSPYWIRRDGAPSLCFLRFIIVLIHWCASSQHKRLRAGKERPLLSLQRRAQNNQCNSKLFIHPQCQRDLGSSVMVQINHVAHVKNLIIYFFKI